MSGSTAGDVGIGAVTPAGILAPVGGAVKSAMEGGPDSNPPIGQIGDLKYTDQDTQNFLKTKAGEGYTASDLAGVANATEHKNGAWSNTGGNDITGLVNDFNTWLSQQAQMNSEHTQYADLAKAQPGRDATILTGPAVNPNMTLLGSPVQSPIPSTVLGAVRRNNYG